MLTISAKLNTPNTKKIFHFACKKCDSNLSIRINPNTLLINAKCESDFNHVFNNLYIGTFEKYYMKEEQLYKCSSCNNILDNIGPYYYCINKDKIICTKCKLNEEKINNSYEWKLIEKFKCKIHNINYTSYCELCNKNICLNCEKEGHKQHKILKYSSIILTKKEIEYTSNKLKEKEKFTTEVIRKLNIWKKNTDNNKVDRLILNLKNELSFLQKIFYNYNDKIMNYSYNKNMKIICEYINNQVNNNLKEFLNANNLKEEKDLMLIILNDLGNHQKNSPETEQIENKDILYTQQYDKDRNLLIEKINNDYFILSTKNSLNLVKFEKNEIKILNTIDFHKRIYSMTNSLNDNQIYICLLGTSQVKIIDYNLEEKTLKFNNESITYSTFEDNYFSKCIKINNFFITSGLKKIFIWYKNTKYNKFDILQYIELTTFTSDLLYMDDYSFISSQPDDRTLIIFDSNNFNKLKIIHKIDCVDYLHCLFKVKNKYIIINCFGGIGLLLIDTKEIVQYIQIESNPFEKQLIYDDRNLIYLLTINLKKFIIKVFKINDNSIKYIKKIDVNPPKVNRNYQISCNNNIIVFCRDHLHNIIKNKRDDRLKDYDLYDYYNDGPLGNSEPSYIIPDLSDMWVEGEAPGWDPFEYYDPDY